VEKDK